MIRSNESDKIRETILKELDCLLEKGGVLRIEDIAYIKDKIEPKYFPLIERSLKSKKIEEILAGAYLAMGWKLKEFAPLV